MSTKDAILGHVCVERGWMSEPQLEECLKECDSLERNRPGRDGELLPSILLRRHLIPEMELEALRVEIDKVLRPKTPASGDGTEDLRLLKLLLRDGRVAKDQVDRAMAQQRELLSRGRTVRVIELLLESGHLTLTALEDAFMALRHAATSVTCRSCRAVYSIVNYDAGRIYLCKACTGELAPTGAPAPAAAPPTSSASSAILPSVGEGGARIGKYSSLQEIGRGGMGRVYKAWDEVHKRWVALKVISDKQPLEGLTRFRREVEISRSLHHPNIVAVYEVATVEGRHLISMQFVDGVTLEGERRSARRAAELVAVIANALQYAHAHGVIHRDIKPQNIMIDRAGKPYLMDFGMAKAVDSPGSVTAAGTAMGTPSYMAPEMALGKTTRVDRRSDVYSLGAVLYGLVTGVPPFRGSSPMDTLQRVANEEVVPPSKVVAGVPATLEAVVLKCLQKERNDRYPTAKQVAEELERILPQLPG
jgi:predicted Ser/Thr protein kinase